MDKEREHPSPSDKVEAVRQKFGPQAKFGGWVNNTIGTDAVGYGQQPESPFATLNYAISQASPGDFILLLPDKQSSRHIPPAT